MRRPKYKHYERLTLEYLVTKTDGGRCLRSDIEAYWKIPPSSMSNVLSDMAKNKLVVRRPWFRKQEVIVISDLGQQLYSDIVARPLAYGLPYHVRTYLEKRIPKVKHLHSFQSSFVNRGLLSARDNVCVFAYPGSGKTLVAEMAMVETVKSGGKTLYCTPYKALDWQKYEDFKQSFSQLGASVAISDGDNPVRLEELEHADVIIGTYERVMGAIRRRENWLSQLDLICADEITLLADKERGAVIDLLLTLMKHREKNLRIITLSSIVGNALDIAKWLNAKPLIENRPLPGITMEEYIVGKEDDRMVFWSRDGDQRKQTAAEPEIEYLVRSNLDLGRTTLVFVGPRAETQKVAEQLKPLHTVDPVLASLVDEFKRSSYFEETTLTSQLCDLLKFGVAFHHAGLHKRVRRFVERLLKDGKLKTIVATTTLTHGIDYKIDCVVIDYPSVMKVHPLLCYEYINYKGRAGRYGKSNAACVYILCGKFDSQVLFSKFFLGSPEAVLPQEATAGEEIATMILAATTSGNVTSSGVKRIANDTLWAATHGAMLRLNRLLAKLCDDGFLVKDGERYTLTELGRMTNDANISPGDAIRILKLGTKPSVTDLVTTATSIDLVRKFRLTSVRRKDPTNMLLDWINEMPIDSIRGKYHEYYDDGDILLLGEYTALALQKIAAFTRDSAVKREIGLLVERLRCGVKEDIAVAGFTKLPALVREKARPLARALMKSGINNLEHLSEASPPELIRKLNLVEYQATSLIADAQRVRSSPA